MMLQHKAFVVDDGSATIRCIIWTNLSPSPEPSARALVQQPLTLGQFVHVRGALQWRDDSVTLVVHSIHAHNDPNAESMWWLQLECIYTRVYSKPFSISSVLPESTPYSQLHQN